MVVLTIARESKDMTGMKESLTMEFPPGREFLFFKNKTAPR